MSIPIVAIRPLGGYVGGMGDDEGYPPVWEHAIGYGERRYGRG